ncbi:MAG: polyprenyl synthetase family protein [Candidatus Zipacnadales bacterium]
MDFHSTLKQYQHAIEKHLLAFIKAKGAAYTSREVERWVYDVLGDFVLRGGKRIRAIMAITAYEGATGLFGEPRIIEASCALEFLDAYFLVQDDVIDLSELRRGKPSAHVMLSEYAQNVRRVPPDEAQAFGLKVAIGIGDIFNAWGIECLLGADFPPDRILAAIRTYNSAGEVICRGEIKDIYLGLSTVTVTENDYIDMILEKTGYYVTRAPALIGLDLAGVSGELREAMIAFTEPLGLAFQIRDDILDLTSTKAELGKPIGTDLREGKNTLPILYARENTKPEVWADINTVLGNHTVSETDIRRVRQLLEESGALSFAKERMASYLGTARKALNWLAALGFASEIITFYEDLVDFIGNRRH